MSYAGYSWDPVLGVYLSDTRPYNPATGTWMSQDPIRFAAGDPNLNRYVGNGPTNGRDPSGLVDYRGAFKKETPDLPNDWKVHHTKQQALADRYLNEKGINIHDSDYLRGVPVNVHYEINDVQAKMHMAKMRDMGLLKPGECLNESNSARIWQKYWDTVPLEDIEKMEKRLTMYIKTYG